MSAPYKFQKKGLEFRVSGLGFRVQGSELCCKRTFHKEGACRRALETYMLTDKYLDQGHEGSVNSQASVRDPGNKGLCLWRPTYGSYSKYSENP